LVKPAYFLQLKKWAFVPLLPNRSIAHFSGCYKPGLLFNLKLLVPVKSTPAGGRRGLTRRGSQGLAGKSLKISLFQPIRKVYNGFMAFDAKSYYQEKFNHLSLTREKFDSLSFEECEFTGCQFIECHFALSRFLNCIFNACILSAVVAKDSRFDEVQFNGCKVIGMDWTLAYKVRDLQFMQSQINYSNFRFLKLAKIKIVKCEAKEVDFIETDLSGGEFQETDFEKSRFFKTDLTRANFKGARNYFIDPRNNTLKKTVFSMPEAMGLLHGLDIVLD
jgi:fluoroquinolone resistance protein